MFVTGNKTKTFLVFVKTTLHDAISIFSSIYVTKCSKIEKGFSDHKEKALAEKGTRKIIRKSRRVVLENLYKVLESEKNIYCERFPSHAAGIIKAQ